MQILALDSDPVAAARALCDRHVHKLAVEACQLLSTALARVGKPHPYQPRPQGKELVDWLLADPDHWAWTLAYVRACLCEHEGRYGTRPRTWEALEAIEGQGCPCGAAQGSGAPARFPRRWRQGAPAEVLASIADDVAAHRAYYRWLEGQMGMVWRSPGRRGEWMGAGG